jgi:hypothetical protein
MSEESRWEALLETTRDAAQAAAEAEAELDRRGGEPPRPGDLYAHPATAAWGVEWLVLEEGGDGRWLLVPADTHPLAGSRDVEISAGEPSGPLVLRCGHGVGLDGKFFEAAERSGEISAAALHQARDKHHRIEAGTLRGDPLEREVDEDPEYEDWLAETVTPARQALAPAGSGEPRARGRGASARPPAYLPRAVAAGLAAAGVGLLLWSLGLQRETRTLIAENQELQHENLGLQQQLDRWSRTSDRPFLIGSYGEVLLGESERAGLPEEIPAPEEGSVLLVTFVLGDKVPILESYRVEVLDLENGVSWKSPPAEAGVSGAIMVTLPPAFLTGDRLEIRLLGVTEQGLEPLEEKTVRLIHPRQP